MYAVSLSLEDVPELMDEDPAEAAARVDRAIDALQRHDPGPARASSSACGPSCVDRTDLVGLLVALAEQLHQNSLVEVEAATCPSSLVEPPAARARRAAPDRPRGPANVARHAGATEATVRARAGRRRSCVLEIRDNGRGFDPTTTPRDGHFGLANMRDRAAALRRRPCRSRAARTPAPVSSSASRSHVRRGSPRADG